LLLEICTILPLSDSIYLWPLSFIWNDRK